MLLPWPRPTQWQPGWIYMLHMGAKLIQAQAVVVIVLDRVMIVLVDGRRNLGWSMRAPNWIQR